MPFATLNDITLHYRLDGTPDGVPLVFINSLGSDLRIWQDVATHFAHRHPILCYDKRGHGLSTCPAGPYTISDHAHDLAGLLDQVGFQAVVLIGISVGGMIALEYTLNQPQRVRALVLCDTGATIGNTALWNDRITAVRDHGLASIATAVLARWFTPTFIDQQPIAYQAYADMLLRTPAEGYLGTCAALRDADYRDRVPAIQPPALVLCGAADQATPPDLSRALAVALPHSRFALIENAGHLPCIEQPARMGGLIEQFLREIL